MITQDELQGLDCTDLRDFMQTFIITAWNSGQKTQAKQKIRKLSDDQKIEFNNFIDDMEQDDKIKWKNILIECSFNPLY